MAHARVGVWGTRRFGFHSEPHDEEARVESLDPFADRAERAVDPKCHATYIKNLGAAFRGVVKDAEARRVSYRFLPFFWRA